jgi:hypothetical protein
MTEPFVERGVWCFWLAADEPILQFVNHLNCVLTASFMAAPFLRRPSGRAMIAINPRYDHQEVWLWIYELLEMETQNIELSERWEAMIDAVCQQEANDSEWE